MPKLTIGDAFDEAFDLYKRNFKLFVLVAALLFVPADAIFAGIILGVRADQFQNSAKPTPAEMDRVFGMAAAMMVGAVIYYILQAAISGAMTLVASERYLDRPITIGQAYRTMFRALPRLIGSWLLVGLILFFAAIGLFIVLMFISFAVLSALGAMSAQDPAVGVAIAIIFLVGCVVTSAAIFIWFGAFVTPAVMLEGAGAGSAIQRNIELVRGRAFKLVVAFICLVVVAISIQNALVLAIAFIGQLIVQPFYQPTELVERIGGAILGGVVGLLLQPLWMTFFTVVYYDLRVRKEGFDVALMLSDIDVRRQAALLESSEPAG
jgi:hypothetical protein